MIPVHVANLCHELRDVDGVSVTLEPWCVPALAVEVAGPTGAQGPYPASARNAFYVRAHAPTGTPYPAVLQQIFADHVADDPQLWSAIGSSLAAELKYEIEQERWRDFERAL